MPNPKVGTVTMDVTKAVLLFLLLMLLSWMIGIP